MFHFVRDYETVKIEQDISNEYVLVFQGGEAGEEELFEDTEKRPKAAYYKNLERKINLKKKRINVCINKQIIEINLLSLRNTIRHIAINGMQFNYLTRHSMMRSSLSAKIKKQKSRTHCICSELKRVRRLRSWMRKATSICLLTWVKTDLILLVKLILEFVCVRQITRIEHI